MSSILSSLIVVLLVFIFLITYEQCESIQNLPSMCNTRFVKKEKFRGWAPYGPQYMLRDRRIWPTY